MIIRTDSLEIFKQNEYTLTDIGYVSNNAYEVQEVPEDLKAMAKERFNRIYEKSKKEQ